MAVALKQRGRKIHFSHFFFEYFPMNNVWLIMDICRLWRFRDVWKRRNRMERYSCKRRQMKWKSSKKICGAHLSMYFLFRPKDEAYNGFGKMPSGTVVIVAFFCLFSIPAQCEFLPNNFQLCEKFSRCAISIVVIACMQRGSAAVEDLSVKESRREPFGKIGPIGRGTRCRQIGYLRSLDCATMKNLCTDLSHLGHSSRRIYETLMWMQVFLFCCTAVPSWFTNVSINRIRIFHIKWTFFKWAPKNLKNGPFRNVPPYFLRSVLHGTSQVEILYP